jgi:hypothetical protein
MTMDICNASQSFDIEGAHEKFDDLKLEDFQGYDVTACTATAQKYINIMQSRYTPLEASQEANTLQLQGIRSQGICAP